MDLNGKVVIVTGAVGAIGKGICLSLAGEGMHVVVADLSQDSCDSFAEEINASGESALGVAVDVASAESTVKLAQRTLERFGQIDALINNAGIIAAAPLVDHTEEDFDRIISVNLKGTFLCTKAVAPHMIQRRIGRIVNVSSVAAKRPGPLQSAYAASKHGMLGLMQVWCQELGPYNITVNAVGPGLVQSQMWTDHLNPALAPLFGMDSAGMIDTLAKDITPLGRVQTPSDIGEAVAYLCKADNVSGQVLLVDGGLAMW
jgi:NAD(P)-dependent dehydrogenase (short-subunit alcohol dehydrogenase family)